MLKSYLFGLLTFSGLTPARRNTISGGLRRLLSYNLSLYSFTPIDYKPWEPIIFTTLGRGVNPKFHQGVKYRVRSLPAPKLISLAFVSTRSETEERPLWDEASALVIEHRLRQASKFCVLLTILPGTWAMQIRWALGLSTVDPYYVDHPVRHHQSLRLRRITGEGWCLILDEKLSNSMAKDKRVPLWHQQGNIWDDISTSW